MARKNIDPSDKVKEKLSIQAIKKGTNLKNYIEMFLEKLVNGKYKNGKIMDLKKLKTEKIKEIRNCLVGEYIGEWKKPKQYFVKLKELDSELKART